jgi:hypothetical protein
MLDSVRLHISPFTPDILPLILSSSLQDIATDISFHELATFPERNYGFVTLPIMEAQRLRKKVNGSILRGGKVKVEEARPKKAVKVASDEDKNDAETQDSQERQMRKRKRQEGVVPAYELKDERKVKRGWTEPAAVKVKEKREKKGKDKSDKKTTKKRQEPSAYTQDAECLFKTEVPPNKQDSNASEKNTSQKKRSKRKRTVVHEFEHTEKHPSFLRSSATSGKELTVQYDEEMGWVDASGAVVEPKKTKSRKQVAQAPPSPPSDEAPAVDHERLGSLTLHEQDGDNEDDETSSSGSSLSDASSGSSSANTAEPLQPVQRPSISVSPAPEVSVEATAAADSASATPHPLEALYKKPALPNLSEKNKANLSVDPVPFSFFSSADAPPTASAEQSVETATLVSPPSSKPKRGAAARLPNLAIPPQTPYTQRDMSWRAQRSAAPTPDTALPGRGWPSLWSRSRGSRVSTDEIEEEEEDDDDVMASVEAPLAEADEGEGNAAGQEDNESGDESADAGADDTPIKKTGASGKDKNQSSFAREFYEKRGEFNRSWKQARREAGKAQRASTNRQRKA